jgi:hypothetical protein
MVGSVCHIKWFTTGSRNSLKVEKVEMGVQKWLKQQSKKTSVLQVLTHWQSDGMNVSMLVEDMSRNKFVF